ncbi:hypothetical protein BVG16_29300 [Paenibacillus selenitireducens]|uniref:Uncharacterized protein n=1 Tax=Paenibacillus selenitireducens TaxID=1324314 RepID=A0A1T2X162_9BACL|nr:hypothetical protein BVG16_29300 [Paenibacillus selenitireducens]
MPIFHNKTWALRSFFKSIFLLRDEGPRKNKAPKSPLDVLDTLRRSHRLRLFLYNIYGAALLGELFFVRLQPFIL